MAVVDATIVERAARPRHQIEVVAEDRAEGEAPHFLAMVSDCTARRVLADKGLSSAANRACLAAAGIQSGIMFRASREASPVPAPPPVQPAGVTTAVDRGANLRHPEASLQGGAVPVHGMAGGRSRADLEVDGAEPAQGGQPDRAGRGLRAGVRLESARCGASGPETALFGPKSRLKGVAATGRRPPGAQPAPNGETQRKHPLSQQS